MIEATDARVPAASAEQLAVAAQILGEFGPSGGGRRYPLSDVEGAAGVSRSTIKRLWPTVRDLADDITLHAACRRPDWHGNLVEADPGRPLEEVVAASIGAAPTLTGILHRTAIRVRPVSPVTEAMRRWELDVLDDLAAWFARHVASAGRTLGGRLSFEDLALIVVAQVEGWLYLEAARRAPSTRIGDGLPAAIGRSISRTVREATRPIDASDGPHPAPSGRPGPPRLPELDARRTQVVDDAVRHIEQRAYGEPGGPVPTRLVDLGQFARAAGVSVRRAQMIWPTSSLQNAELTEFLWQRVRGAIEALLADSVGRFTQVASDLSNPSPGSEAEIGIILARLLGDFVEMQADRTFATPMFCSLSLVDPVVAERMREQLQVAQTAQGTMFLAAVQLIRYQLDPDADLSTYADLVYASAVGSSLVGLLQPDLVARRTAVGGVDVSLLGVGFLLAIRSLTDAYQSLGPAEWA